MPPAPFASAALAPGFTAPAWPITLLGVTFDSLTLADAVDRIETMIAAPRPHYVVTPNVDFLFQARRDAELRQVLAQADLVLCDGRPLVWASRWLGNRLPERVAGSDLAPVLLRRAEERGWRIFLLGGRLGVAAAAARRIATQHPALPPVGHYSPPCEPLEEMNHAEIIARIQAARPDLVLVCFGCPKQEKWIFRHYRALGAPVVVGAGGTVDFLAGRLKRAPLWMRRVGAEWLFRLWQEPRRLARRYAGDMLFFFPALLAQRWRLPPAREMAAESEAPACATMAYGIKVAAGAGLDHPTLRRAPSFWFGLAEQPGHCLVDLAAVTSVDSTGLAFLARWQRRLAERRRNLILFRPSLVVRSSLARLGLTEQFVIVGPPEVGLGPTEPIR